MNMAVGLIPPPMFPRQARSEGPRSEVVGVGQMVFSFSCGRDSPNYCDYHTRLFAVSVAVAALYSRGGYKLHLPVASQSTIHCKSCRPMTHDR